jgi:hypothetical protein
MRHRRARAHRRDVRSTARPARRRPRGPGGAGPPGCRPVAEPRAGRNGPARSWSVLGLGHPDRAGRLRPALPRRAAGPVPAGAYQGRHRGPAGAAGHDGVPAGRRVLARRAEDPGRRPGRLPRSPARRRAALAGRGGRVLGRRMLGHPGRARPDGGRLRGRGHAGPARPRRRRLSLRPAPRARPAAQVRPGALPLLRRRAAGRDPGQGRTRPGRRPGRGQEPARRGRAPVTSFLA